MINTLKPYDDYQVTEYDWLGRVPSHWKRIFIRSITELSDERNGSRTDLELLSVYREYGVIKKSSRNDNHNVESEDLSNYKYVDEGYLVLNKMKMWQGSLGVSRHRGIVSPAYIVCKLKGTLNSDFINYLLRAAIYKTIYNKLSYGVRVGQWDMRYDDFKNIIIYIPPEEEQDKIVRYLDNKLLKINKFIKAKKKQIQLLKEQKQAIINKAVTKGLDPKARMKPSEIEWIGLIPDNWEVRYLFQVTDEQKISNKNLQNQNLLSLSYGKIVNKDINRTDGLLPASFDTYQVIHDGNIILRLTDLQNDHKSLRVGLATQTGIITSAYTCLALKEPVIPNFLYLLLHSYDIRKVFYRMGSGVRQSMSYADIKKLPVLIPSIDEQKCIVDYCFNLINKIESMIESIEKEITLVSEYRTSLISNVVTGKVDIRHFEVEDKMEELQKEIEELEEEVLNEDESDGEKED